MVWRSIDAQGDGREKEKKRRGEMGGKKKRQGGESWRELRRTGRLKTEGESFNGGRHVHKQ